MKYAIITCVISFEACHYLPGHKGKCKRLHGHSYLLEVSVRGSIKRAPDQSDDGMVMDFGDLKSIVNAAIINDLSDVVTRGPLAGTIEEGGMDHNNLNDVTGIRTTAENLAHWIWEALIAVFSAEGFPTELLYRIRLWETERGYVEITKVERGEE